MIWWELSQILPYRSARRVNQSVSAPMLQLFSVNAPLPCARSSTIAQLLNGRKRFHLPDRFSARMFAGLMPALAFVLCLWSSSAAADFVSATTPRAGRHCDYKDAEGWTTEAGGTSPPGPARPCCRCARRTVLLYLNSITTAAASGQDRPSCVRATRNSPSRAPELPGAWFRTGFFGSTPASSAPGPRR
jgi:hypothetical protein